MKVSNKLLVKLFLLLLICGLIFVTVFLFIFADYCYYFYENDYKTFFAYGIICTFVTIVVIGFIIKYLVKTNRLIKKVQKYKDFMISTNQYTIDAIAKEFGEPADAVEKTIQEAIDKHILQNVYLSKQTKEILIVNKVPTASVQGNVQNVNLENNVIINDNNK